MTVLSAKLLFHGTFPYGPRMSPPPTSAPTPPPDSSRGGRESGRRGKEPAHNTRKRSNLKSQGRAAGPPGFRVGEPRPDPNGHMRLCRPRISPAWKLLSPAVSLPGMPVSYLSQFVSGIASEGQRNTTFSHTCKTPAAGLSGMGRATNRRCPLRPPSSREADPAEPSRNKCAVPKC